MTTLVTGATGYLGGYVVERLLARGERVVALVRARDDAEARARLWAALELHRTPDPGPGPRDAAALEAAGAWLAGHLAAGRLTPVRGDVRLPDLGLDAAARDRVAAEVTGVVHAAATLNRRSSRACMDVNLRGALEVARLVRAQAERGRLRRYVHVSTVAIAGRRQGEVVGEDAALDFARSDWDPYAATKKFAEHLTERLLGDLPVVTVRPSIVLGDATRAATTQFDMALAFVRLAQSPVLPFVPEARLDIVPADFVAEALCDLHLAPAPRHRAYHLAAGRTSPTFREVTDALARDLGLRPPRFAPALAGPGGRAVAALSRLRGPLAPVGRLGALLDVFWPYLTWDVVFDHARVVAETGRTPARFPDTCAALFRFCRAHGFTYPHAPPPAAVLAAPAPGAPPGPEAAA